MNSEFDKLVKEINKTVKPANYKVMVKRPGNGSSAWEVINSYPTLEDATATAKSLANNCPGTEYYVMLAVSMTSVVKPQATTVLL